MLARATQEGATQGPVRARVGDILVLGVVACLGACHPDAADSCSCSELHKSVCHRGLLYPPGDECRCDRGFIETALGTCVANPCADHFSCINSGRRCVPDPDALTYRCDCPAGQVTSGQACVSDRRERAWSVLVYQAADNDLEPELTESLAELQEVGSSEDVNVVVQFDGLRLGAARYYVRSHALELIEAMDEPNTGDAATLDDFVAWAASRFPSRRTFLIIAGHGYGWLGVAADQTSADTLDLAGSELTTALLRINRTLGRPLDLLAFDACSMGSWEVGTTLRGVAPWVVASEEIAAGWPDAAILHAVVAAPEISPEELCRTTASLYIERWQLAKSDTCLSMACYDGRQSDALRAAVLAFAREMMAAEDLKGAIREAAAGAYQLHGDPRWVARQDGPGSLAVDLGGFARSVAALSAAGHPLLTAAAEGVSSALNAYAALQLSYGGDPSCRALSGVSIYLPVGEEIDMRWRAGWGSTAWYDFIAWLAR
jgi:hypothetical protein